MSKKVTRGIRNNNPGNIRRSKDKWQGLSPTQTDSEFFQFKDPIYGLRALAILLINYQDDHQLRTIERIINRWAPPNENDTGAYALAVAKSTGFGLNKALNMHDFACLAPMIKAIVQHENGGMPYTDAQITKACVLAGVEPANKSLPQTRTVRGGLLATIMTVLAGIWESIQDVVEPVKEQLTGVLPYLPEAKYVLIALTLLGVFYMLWARLDDSRKGLR